MATDGIRRLVVRLSPSIFGPTLLFAIGQGAVVPLVPVLAVERGATPASAALVGGCFVIGQLMGNIPGGWLTAKIGERRTMVIATGVALVGAGCIGLIPGVLALAAATLLLGVGAAGFGIARHTFMTMWIPLEYRGRALSTLSGALWLGLFIGPLASAALLSLSHDQASSIWILATMLFAAGALILLTADPAEASERSGLPRPPQARHANRESPRPRLYETIVQHHAVLVRLGGAGAALASVRASRQILLPLVGVSVGLAPATIALVVAVVGALEFALFYPSGQIMDRVGRIWAAVPSMALLATGLGTLAVVAALGLGLPWLVVAAVIIGIGSGIGSGVLLTFSSDTAPAHDPGPYLGAWRTVTDAGSALTPFLASGLLVMVAMPATLAVFASIALMGMGAFARWVPMYLPGAARETRTPPEV